MPSLTLDFLGRWLGPLSARCSWIAAAVLVSARLDANAQVGATSESGLTIKLGSTEVQLFIREGPKEAPIYLNLHENERTSVEAARRVLTNCTGSLVRLQGQGERLMTFYLDKRKYVFDPNRIFTESGLVATLAKYTHDGDLSKAAAEVRKLRDEVLALLVARTGPIVALHNNAASKTFSFASYEFGAYKEEAKLTKRASGQPDSAFFLLTNSTTADRLHAAGFNVVLQSLHPTDDGSLSVWSQMQSREYVNVEAKAGKLDLQRRMLDAVCSVYR